MAGNLAHKKSMFAFAVFVLFLVSNTAFAFHHHQGDLSHDDCPICFTAQVASSVDHDFSALNIQFTNITVSDLIPREYHSFFKPLILTPQNNRAPPA